MSKIKHHERTRAQESSNAIERMYITMRHLFNRGFYKPMGVSGETLREALLLLRPEIYGSIGEEKAELEGLLYVIDRLPQGIEECTFINLTSDEGYANSHFKPIIPPKRRRNCYRIDSEQMNIEITRGRSEIYDILTHLTFMFIESHKISKRVIIDETGNTTRDWKKLESAVLAKKKLTLEEREVAISHTANILGRTFNEIVTVYDQFASHSQPERLLHIVYWLGKLAIEEVINNNKRTVTFSPVLRERLGHHIHGEIWSNNIKEILHKNELLERPIHIISANMHSVMNSLFASQALKTLAKKKTVFEVYEALSEKNNQDLRNKVTKEALQNGMIYIPDSSGTNIDVQIFDTAKIDFSKVDIDVSENFKNSEKPVIFVMDYAFGEQAYETIDELLKPIRFNGKKVHLNVESISIMGKAGILEGGKGDIMIPSAHIFEGTADNYPFKNELSKKDLDGHGVAVYKGAMITVLGTSLQNKEILKFFFNSTWNVIGLEMEGAHYQKAIQAASKVRHSINPKVKVRYAYYASDNPLETGSTLASGGLGTSGVKPTYLITRKILEQIFN
ncbi:MAG: hypothetical protein CMP05_03415 [Xanthomarina sp.]|jgi:hypothetical protein|uniref:DUF6909 family protein n=1 Tax=Xanthomarina TaxID=1868329 RepID=UPI00058F56F3|nr:MULTISPECIES: hypothetical protein [Xanthomarina]MCB0388591.1 hypothetical protein [Winogradskyella sp.]MAL22486.1 hypothetical protein [Xanthomarina sp.]MBF61028.1 hypothetical protein [Xanthomarina sp.]HAB29052.1 hypothetical protein [Xanthomarina gelatinilytica]HAI17397.1 hypothetical protein [Xanthomarina gelatinilytica]|tara:strand:- start:874 stop:2562 length:1689 start_codon:yes stop_codon:yes gene_type:complete